MVGDAQLLMTSFGGFSVFTTVDDVSRPDTNDASAVIQYVGKRFVSFITFIYNLRRGVSVFFAFVCLSVCLHICRISQKVVDKISWKGGTYDSHRIIGADPDHDPNQGIFLWNFYHHCGMGSTVRILWGQRGFGRGLRVRVLQVVIYSPI